MILTTPVVMNGARVQIKCNGKVNTVSAWLSGTSFAIGRAELIDGHTIRVQIDTPNWSPSNPLVVTIYGDEDLGHCGIS